MNTTMGWKRVCYRTFRELQKSRFVLPTARSLTSKHLVDENYQAYVLQLNAVEETFS